MHRPETPKCIKANYAGGLKEDILDSTHRNSGLRCQRTIFITHGLPN